MAKYNLYKIKKTRNSSAVHFYRLNLDTGETEDWRSYRLIDGKPAYKWQRSRMPFLSVIERCTARYWINNGCGAILIGKNVEFK